MPREVMLVAPAHQLYLEDRGHEENIDRRELNGILNDLIAWLLHSIFMKCSTALRVFRRPH